jgi:hypothetical protein
MIEILCRSESETLVLEILGDLNAPTTALLTSCLEAALDSDASAVVIDLRQAGCIDPCIAGAVHAMATLFAEREVSLSVRDQASGPPDDQYGVPAATLDGRHDEVLGVLAVRGGGFNGSLSTRPSLTDQIARW